jgi:hypothetical protein
MPSYTFNTLEFMMSLNIFLTISSDNLPLYVLGCARLSNVEFVKTGQEGFTESYDPRFSLSFVGTGDATRPEKPSYVRKCAFHHGFSPAIGLFGTNNIEVIDNVIHHTVGSGKYLCLHTRHRVNSLSVRPY